MEDGPTLGVVQRRGAIENAQNEADEHEAGERLQAQSPAYITNINKNKKKSLSTSFTAELFNFFLSNKLWVFGLPNNFVKEVRKYCDAYPSARLSDGLDELPSTFEILT